VLPVTRLTDAHALRHTGPTVARLDRQLDLHLCFAAAFGNTGQASYVEVVVGALLPNTRQL
jgi:hypothetical protein